MALFGIASSSDRRLRTFATALSIGALVVGFADAASPASADAIQPLGAFHHGEAVARDGDTWLTLWRAGEHGAARLTQTRVRVARVYDPISDAEGQRTGEEVSVPVPADGREIPLMLLRSNRVRVGAVETAVVEERSADGLLAYDFRLNGQASRLDTVCAPEPTSERIGVGELPRGACRWVFSADGHERQTLLELSAAQVLVDGHATWSLDSDASPHLLFAGDLDRDGRLDLIIDATDHYNLSLPTLFLSSAAGPGQFLRRVSEHRAVGC